MSNVIEFKPALNVEFPITCPACEEQHFQILACQIKMEESDETSHIVKLHCLSCEYDAPAFLILPVGDD